MRQNKIIAGIAFCFIAFAIASAFPVSAKADSNYYPAYSTEVNRVTPFIRVVFPNSGNYNAGKPLSVKWQGLNLSGSGVDISIKNKVTGLSYSLATSTPNSGSTTIAIPQNVPGGSYKLSVRASTSTLMNIFDDSSSVINIVAASETARTIKIVNQPSLLVALGKAVSTSWVVTGNIPKVNAYMVSISGASTTIGTNMINTGSLSYVVPIKTASSSYFIKIVDSASSTISTTTSAFAVSADPAILILPATLPAVVVNASYSTSTVATGGSGSGYLFKATGLPKGLSMSKAGVISGKVTSATYSPYSVVVTATDSNKNSVDKAYSLVIGLTVVDPIVISPATATTLPAAIANNKYVGKTFGATGGSGSGYVFTATGLPSGLTLSKAGVLSGTPKTSGSNTVVVTVTDNKHYTGSAIYTLVVSSASTITITPATLPAAVVNASYSTSTIAVGGSGSGYTFSATGLPKGLSISRSGAISGKVTSTGSNTVVISAKDSIGNTGSTTYTLVSVLPPSLVISPETLPAVIVGTAYSTSTVAVGGSGSGYTFSATGLPRGLSMSKAGAISGKVTSATASPVSVIITVKDSNGNSVTKTYLLVVSLTSR